MEEILIPLAFFGSLALIIWIVMSQKNKAKTRTAELIHALIAKDKNVTPEIIKSIGYVPARSHGDLRASLILIAFGIALYFFGGMIPEEEAQKVFGGLSAFPILIGIALLAFWGLISRHENN